MPRGRDSGPSRHMKVNAVAKLPKPGSEGEGSSSSEGPNGEKASIANKEIFKKGTNHETVVSLLENRIIASNDTDTAKNKKSTDDTSTSVGIDLDTALKKLHLPEHDEQSAQDIVKKNEEISKTFLNCIMTIISMTNGDDADAMYYLNEINFTFFEVEHEKRSTIGDFFSHIKYAEVSFQQYKQLLKNIDMEHFRENDIMNSEISELICLLRSHWWNFADCSSKFGATLVTHGVIKEMVLDIQNMIDIDATILKNSFTFESAIGTLHNVAKIESLRQTFRDLKLADVLGNFLNYENLPKVTMLTLLTLALIIDEDQTDLLFSHESSFNLLIMLANRAWKMSDHRYDGFSVEELILGLKGLSKNDKVKRLLVEKGILDLVSMVLTYGKDDEKEIAAKLLWELSFDPVNKALILENETVMEVLKSLSDDSSKKIARTAQGAMWVLQMGSKKKKPQLTKNETGGKIKSSKSQGHIMISYNWNDQKQLIKIKDSLKSNGFPVWMDIENISGSTLQAMAEAVEGSLVVLICLSEKYKESINCRSEAEYAFALNKPIVPLIMQERYKPDGWLGILLGTKLFFDFSGRHTYEAKMSELLKDLVGRGINTDEDVTDGPIVKTAAPLVGKAPKANLSQIDIKKWILEHKLEKYPLLQSLEPVHLQFLKRICSKAPEFYYKLMMDLLSEKLTLENLNALMQVTDGVDKLPT